MKYYWNDHGKNNPNIGVSAGQPHPVEISIMEESRTACPDIYRKMFSGGGLNHIRFCKASVFRAAVAGTFVIPPKEDPPREKQAFGYCLAGEKLISMDGNGHIRGLLGGMQDYQMTDATSLSLQLFDVTEYLPKGDVIFLQRYEDRPIRLERGLLERESGELSVRILTAREGLSVLSIYYEQLSDMGEILQQDAAEKGSERDSLLFGLFSDKAGCFYTTVQMMKEYSMQLREMHQTQVDIRQSEIMRFFTAMTTVFTSLSLIAGWYGTSFINMPELDFPYGHAVICILYLLIVVVKIQFFKGKKWFQDRGFRSEE